MVKAVFCDFYGTVVNEYGPLAYEIMQRIYKSGKAGSMQDVLSYWWSTYRDRLYKACGESFRLQRDLALENFKELTMHFHSTESAEELNNLMTEHWCNPPIYDDTKIFLENLKLPIYFVTNSDDFYVEEAIQNHGLKPTGIITSEQAKYSKPHKEIFEYALKKAGLKAEDVIHMGDSIGGDVRCPQSVGIRAIWVNRDSKPVPESVEAINELKEIYKWL